MIPADAFISMLRQSGFRLFTGVPCSYLSPVINMVIDAPDLCYVNATNEGDAVAIAAGAELGGMPAVAMMQNSGLGNAVSPLTSLAAIFRIPLLLIVTWRGQPGGPTDEPQHALMGRILPQCLDIMEIPWEELPANEEELPGLIGRAMLHLRSRQTPFAIVVPHGAVSPYALRSQPGKTAGSAVPLAPASHTLAAQDQDEVLAAVRAASRSNDALLATTGFTGRALYALGDCPNQFYMVGSMGCLSSFGLGLALAQPRRRVLVLDGDGAMLMRMGALGAIGHQRPRNLMHILLDNGVHDSTGGQATVSSTVDMAAVARACGYAGAVAACGAAELQDLLAQDWEGPAFVYVKTAPRAQRKLPRPQRQPHEMAQRFRQWLEITS
jgi:phosphonopyruvate decarboxylase